MTFDRISFRIFLRIAALFITLSAAAFFLVSGREFSLYFFLSLPVIGAQILDFYRLNLKAAKELEQFVESIHYRDFSRHFDERHAPLEVQSLRKGFNEINLAFKVISKEKETQYQYLQKILELVDTGILSYELESGEIVWMNESLKQMLGVPYLKTIASLQKRNEDLHREAINLRPGEHKVIPVGGGFSNFNVLVSATAFHTDGKRYKLLAFQNVHEALDETESKAWQKLLSVMTHEIMNSVAPISSLAQTMLHRLEKSVPLFENSPNALEDLEIGIDTIRRRSEGLLKFAETYRNLNKVTTPNLRNTYVRDLFENTQRLMHPTLQQKGMELETLLLEPDMSLELDASLIEQVLINLVLNAMEAVKESPNPKIWLSAQQQLSPKRITTIRVSDNGIGIAPDLLDKIFVPFFSTRKSGSGIGLSLCKQIMLLHKGSIQVHTPSTGGTSFSLYF